jgi:outer membrane protein TolC
LLPNNTIPDAFQLNNTIAATTLEEFISKGLTQNPTINEYNFKIDALEVERKLKQQSLLPTLNAKANLLNKDYWAFNGLNGNFLQNNYKWGVDFKIPIFLREARGDVQKAKIKISETNLQLNQKKWEVENKVRNYFNEYVQLQNQVNIANVTFNNYNSLYRSELLRFNNGESSLFLVNSRENKALEMLQKTIELRIKLYKSRYAIDWSAGQLR